MSLYTLDSSRARIVMLRLVREGCTPSYLKGEAGELEDAGLIRFDRAFGAGWVLTEKGRQFISEAKK